MQLPLLAVLAHTVIIVQAVGQVGVFLFLFCIDASHSTSVFQFELLLVVDINFLTKLDLDQFQLRFGNDRMAAACRHGDDIAGLHILLHPVHDGLALTGDDRPDLRRELEAIAAAKGIDMQKVDAVSGKGCAVKPSARYSTLQDLDAGRHTEIDMFSGTLIRMGKELGIPTPYNEFTYHMIKALEEKNDGKFDYTGPNQEMTWAR